MQAMLGPAGINMSLVDKTMFGQQGMFPNVTKSMIRDFIENKVLADASNLPTSPAETLPGDEAGGEGRAEDGGDKEELVKASQEGAAEGARGELDAGSSATPVRERDCFDHGGREVMRF
jgi:hypothetical protein